MMGKRKEREAQRIVVNVKEEGRGLSTLTRWPRS